MEAVKAKKSSVSFEIKKHLITLFQDDMTEFSKEVNIVSWHNQPAKLDIRRWENGYPRRGISLDSLEVQILFEALRFFFDRVGSKPYHNQNLDGYAVHDPYRFAYRIHENLAILSTSENGFTREVNVISWNHGPKKIDIRSWSPERYCAKGISIRISEAADLYELLKDVSTGYIHLEETISDNAEEA